MKTNVVRKGTIRAILPCHGETIRVTGRRSKQMERARYHRCTECGQEYSVHASNGTVTKVSPR